MEKSNVEQQKTASAKGVGSSKKINQSDGTLSGVNYKTRYYLAAKKRHCSNHSLNLAKVITDGTSKGFAKCPSCLKWFSSRESLDNHQKKFNHWTKKPGCKCPICRKVFLQVSQRNSHMQCHLHDEHKVEAEKFLSEITCSHCKKCFTNKQQKLKHVAEMKHASPKIPDVNVAVLEKNGINQPKSKQSVKRLPGSNSNRCNTKVKKATKLPGSKKPTGLKPLQKLMLSKTVTCSFCPRLFSSPKNLTRHLQRKHRGVLQYQCSVCLSKFPSFVEAFTHKKKQHKGGRVKQVIVKKYRKRKKTKSDTKQTGSNKLSSTIESCPEDPLLPQIDSTGAPEFTPKGNKLMCVVCNSKKFSCYSALKRHENTFQHKKNVAALNKTKSRDAEGDSNMNILCSVCKKEFTSTNGFVLHRMSHFVSDCDVSSPEAEVSYYYGCEICGDEIFGIKKVQFHLLWHGYSMRCARKSNEMNPNLKPPCSCGKDKSSARISLTCIDCKNCFSGRREFIDHKKKCSKIDENVCLKYCITHDTELCCSNDIKNNHPNAKDRNGDTVTTNPGSDDVESNEQVFSPVNSSHKQLGTFELVDLTVQQMPQPLRVPYAQKVHMPLTCSTCGQATQSLKEFKEHFCSGSGDYFVDTSSKSQSTSHPSSVDNGGNSETAAALTKRLRRRPNAPSDSSSIAEKSENRDSVGRVDSFHHNLSNLLCLLINDEKLMTRLGWGKRPVDVIVVDLLKLFGQESCRKINGMTDAEVFRKNVHSLLQQCLKDTVMKELTNFDSIDSVVKNILMYLTIFQPSIEVRD